MASGFLGLWAAVPFLCPQVLLPASSRGAPCARVSVQISPFHMTLVMLGQVLL